MTDRSTPGRIDLRALDEPADLGRAERIVSAAVSAMKAGAWNSSADILASLAEFGRPMLAAAAVFLLLAAGTVMLTERAASSSPAARLLGSWAESRHVPTNGELLAAFRGYGQ